MNFASHSNLLISHEGPTNSSAVNSNLNSNEVHNITSIIDSFENGNFYRSPGTKLRHLFGVNIERELDNTLLRLDNELVPCVLNDAKYFDRKKLQEYFEKIRLIKQKYSKLYKFLKVVKHSRFQKNYDFVCSTCGQVIAQKNTTLPDTLYNLQRHDHFEQALASRGVLRNQSSCIDNTFMNISLPMAEIPNANEASFSVNGSTSTTVSDYSPSENNESASVQRNEIIPLQLLPNENVESASVQRNDIIPLQALPKREINCNNCGLQTNSVPNFKFDFQINYDSMLEKKLYRDSFAHLDYSDELSQPFLQFKGKQLFTCLICSCEVPYFGGNSVITQHINGGRHMRKKTTPSVIEALFAYHKHWKQQEPKYQAHQTYFLPLNNSSALCVACGRDGTATPYDFLINHINSETHKESFYKSCMRPKGKRFFNCILQVQREVYADKGELGFILQDDFEENSYEKENQKVGAEETYKKEKPQENLDTRLSAIKISGENGRENEILAKLNAAGCSEEKTFSHTNSASKSKREAPIHNSEFDITNDRLNMRRTLTQSALDKADAALQNETNTQSNSNSVKKPQNHEIFKAVANESGSELHELLEHRFLPHLKFFSTATLHTVKCQSCKVTMTKHHKVVREHICSPEHKISSKVPVAVYHSFCEICNALVRQSKRWPDHMKLQKHVERCERLGASRKSKLTEYECATCKLVIFGDDLSIKRHLATAARAGRFRKVKEIILSPEAKTLLKSQQHIQDRSSVLVREANKVLLNQDPVQKCCRALETALADVYPNCKAYPFGSRVSGLGNQNSDLDVFVDMGDMYVGEQKQDARNQEKFVIAACKIFRKRKDEFSHVNPIPTARTPIVQVYHMSSKMDCDLSFRHGLSVENTKFLRLCIDLQPVTQSLILLLKQWVELCKLQENITTYALSMMVIFHLQVGGYLMPVHELRQLNPDNVFVIDGWGVVDFSSSITGLRDHIVPYQRPVAEILREFFYYYSRFNYATDVICPLLGRTVKKNLFLDKPKGEDLPLEMLAYVMKVSSPDAEYFRARSPFCIQDPFDLSHNLVKACSPVVVDKLKTFCDLTFKHLTAMEQ